MTRLHVFPLALISAVFCWSCGSVRRAITLPPCPTVGMRCSGWVTASPEIVEFHTLKGEVPRSQPLKVAIEGLTEGGDCVFPFIRHTEDCGAADEQWWTVSGGDEVDKSGAELTIKFKGTEDKDGVFCFGMKQKNSGRYLTCASPACCTPEEVMAPTPGCASSCACGTPAGSCGNASARRVVVHLRAKFYDPTDLKLPDAVNAFGPFPRVSSSPMPTRRAPIVFASIDVTTEGRGKLESIKLDEITLSATTGGALPDGYATVSNKSKLLDPSFVLAPGKSETISLTILPYTVARGGRPPQYEWLTPSIVLTVQGYRVATKGRVKASTTVVVSLVGTPAPPESAIP